ncbi:MAG: hypothetical protein O9972_22150 [Burkholderiales bacterium]|nr:hypothetical protein [Burkholderiales bacterium]
MTRDRDALPISCPPRGLDRIAAAAYISVSPSFFDKMVDEGAMPPAKRWRGRLIWDRIALDAAFSALPDVETSEAVVEKQNPWHSQG